MEMVAVAKETPPKVNNQLISVTIKERRGGKPAASYLSVNMYNTLFIDECLEERKESNEYNSIRKRIPHHVGVVTLSFDSLPTSQPNRKRR